MQGPDEPTSTYPVSLDVGQTMRLIREDVDSVVELVFSDSTRVRFKLYVGDVASIVRGESSFNVHLLPPEDGVVPGPSLTLIPGGKE